MHLQQQLLQAGEIGGGALFHWRRVYRKFKPAGFVAVNIRRKPWGA
jgi:hypothetical protein